SRRDPPRRAPLERGAGKTVRPRAGDAGRHARRAHRSAVEPDAQRAAEHAAAAPHGTPAAAPPPTDVAPVLQPALSLDPAGRAGSTCRLYIRGTAIAATLSVGISLG